MLWEGVIMLLREFCHVNSSGEVKRNWYLYGLQPSFLTKTHNYFLKQRKLERWDVGAINDLGHILLERSENNNSKYKELNQPI